MHIVIMCNYTHVLITCKYEKDPIKNSGENVMTSFYHYKSIGYFSYTQGQLTPWSNPAKFRTHPSSHSCHSYLQV